MSRGEFDLVERAELEKILTELQLSASGLIDPQSRLNLGRLTGARVLVAGSVFTSGDKNFIVAKVIGTETGRVLAAASNGIVDATDLVPELCEKIADLLRTKGAVILPPPRTVLSVAGALSAVVKGNNRKVYVKITETIGMPAADPAAETEIKKLLVTLGFAVVGSRAEADYALIGEGVAADSGNYQRFTSATARVELTLYKGKEQVLAVDRQKETVAGPSYVIAAKDSPRVGRAPACLADAAGAEIIRGRADRKRAARNIPGGSPCALERTDQRRRQMTIAKIVPGIQPNKVSSSVRRMTPHPLSITASGGKSRQTIRRSASSNAEGTD